MDTGLRSLDTESLFNENLSRRKLKQSLFQRKEADLIALFKTFFLKKVFF